MAILEEATTHERPLSGEANGRIRRSRASDWALIQEPQSSPGYHAVFDRIPVRSDTRLLDVGCGAGLALSLMADCPNEPHFPPLSNASGPKI